MQENLFWTERTTLNRVLDPLGLASLRYSDQYFLNGITTQTQRIRYYTFLTWAWNQIKGKKSDLKERKILDMEKILAAGTASLDSSSLIRQIINDVQSWHKIYPNDWSTTRHLVKEKYTKFNGEMRDKNGFELNTASTIAALIYGEGDFSKTLMTAFNFGWDADNTAATAGTIMGVIKGHKWMMSPKGSSFLYAKKEIQKELRQLYNSYRIALMIER